ncbi:response regulator receiver protein [Paraburkholderia atlantica]|uniref:response regulator receiver protein n=1 Tax=Paraburkholderia atlantica TaxID=2654982 RepID=UPI0017A48C55|nr:response regulator receiver protein [Paraburkholderia atlantica]MBB5417876.1 hypothetical protein [Paraburkholderia atlantica]
MRPAALCCGNEQGQRHKTCVLAREKRGVSSSNPGPTAEDKLAFCVACTALDQATRDLQQLRSNPATSLNALSKAQRDYELTRVQWQRCQWQLRAATAHAVKRPSQCLGAVVIVGHDKAVRDSLRVLLNVKGYGRSKALGFDHWHEIWLEPSRQLIVLDVPVNSITTALWFVESFDTSIDKPSIIALARPEDAASFAGKVDAIVAKPIVLEELLYAIDLIQLQTKTPAHHG